MAGRDQIYKVQYIIEWLEEINERLNTNTTYYLGISWQSSINTGLHPANF